MTKKCKIQTEGTHFEVVIKFQRLILVPIEAEPLEMYTENRRQSLYTHPLDSISLKTKPSD